MKFNMMAIQVAYQKITLLQTYKDLIGNATKKQRREIKDKIVYRLMFNKKRLDDINETDEFFTALEVK